MAKKTTSKVDSVEGIVDWLRRSGTKKTREEMLTRYGIPNASAFGVPMGQMKKFAGAIGKNHQLALELWQSGEYESRTIAVFLDEPDAVTSKQMDQWVRDFDNWAICDTACFHLFDRTRFAWEKAPRWIASPQEFIRRAGFAMIWALSVHDKESENEVFVAALRLIENCPSDERPLVKKAADMALRAVGKKNMELNKSAITTAKRMAKMDDKHRSWIGNHSLREIESNKVQSRLTRP